MPVERTSLVTLPNEIIHHIFDFLSVSDMVRAFTQLNRRFDHMIRLHIKKIDLTDGWQGDDRHLQTIAGFVHKLKIEQSHLHYLFDCQFSQLKSLGLLNVADWQSVVARMSSLRTLSVWFDDVDHYDMTRHVIPQNVLRFSTNAHLTAHSFHSNLTHLSLHVHSLVDLTHIVGKTPSIRELNVVVWQHYNVIFHSAQESSAVFDDLGSRLGRLNALTHLSMTVRFEHNHSMHPQPSLLRKQRSLFDRIRMFIDHYCSSPAVSKHVALKFDYIEFYDDLWPTFAKYKTAFDRFDFYVAFRLTGEEADSPEIPKFIGSVGSHVEGDARSHHKERFLHVYSLPFAFDSLHGFISCSHFTKQVQFLTVRHLYFTEVPLSHPVSFRSLVELMPRLVSVTCTLAFDDVSVNLSEIPTDPGIFWNLSSFRFSVDFFDKQAECHDLLSRLLDRMPHLHKLVPFSNELSYVFNSRRQALESVRVLDLRNSYFTDFHLLPQGVPFLSTLLLGAMPPHVETISETIGNLFIRIRSLSAVSYQVVMQCSQDRTPYRAIADQALSFMQTMHGRLQHLNIQHRLGTVEFSL